jgi:hypothetical protein
MLDLAKASKELDEKNLMQIQSATAYTWGSRAAVAYNRFLSTGLISWLRDADEYYHEALEHAALVQTVEPVTLENLQNALRPLQASAEAKIYAKTIGVSS